MSDYVLDHHAKGESERLALMAQLLDPLHRRLLRHLGLRPGMRTLEIGCGTGSVSAWLAEQIAPGGCAVATDVDLSVAVPGASGSPPPSGAPDRQNHDRRDPDRQDPDRRHPDGSGSLTSARLEFRTADILAGPVPPADFDLATCRAVLHHLPDPATAVANLLASLRPGGSVLLIEPDFLPVTIAEPQQVRDFWDGWLAWSAARGIDYFIGRRLPGLLAGLGATDIEAVAETAVYNGGSPWAAYWQQTITVLRPQLIESGALDRATIDTFLTHCADPSWWTQTIAFTAVSGSAAR